MAGDLPDYYFRIRENGAAVFRVDTENRQRRIDMEEIATVNVRNGVIKPHGETALSPRDLEVMRDWLAARQAVLALRDVDDIHRAVDHLNLTTHWAQSRASEAQLEQVTDALLLAMHDLRSVLVQQGMTEELLQLLTMRQTELDQLAAYERTISPAKKAWQPYLSKLIAADKARAEALMTETRLLLERITAADRNDVLVLQQRKLNLGRQLGQASAGRVVNRAYAANAYGAKTAKLNVQT